MAIRSQPRKLSFDVLTWHNPSSSSEDESPDPFALSRSLSDQLHQNNGVISKPARRKRKNKRKNKKQVINETVSSVEKNGVTSYDVRQSNVGFREKESFDTETAVSITTSNHQNLAAISEDHVANNGVASYSVTEGLSKSVVMCEEVFTVQAPSEGCVVRQRHVGGSGEREERESLGGAAEEEREAKVADANISGGGGFVNNLETAESLDWKKLMAHDPNHAFAVEKLPWKYFMEEMYNGNSLRSTTTLGSDKERERVYDTIFRLPWRCELLINVGFFVCLDSFLSMLTIMPTRLLMALWKLFKRRQFERPSAEELSDVGCFIILSCGVALLGQTDISLIYHMIRGQGTIKLYVVYNVLEVFDRLCQNFGGDILQTLFSSAEGLANSTPETMTHWLWRFISDEILAVASSIVHSFVLLAQAITLSTCIVAHNNALLALLVSNNFAEIKSNVFKRYSKDNIHSLVYFDSIERFHISAFLIFVLAQNILEAEGPWFESFLTNALLVYVCEMMIDIIKHSFIAKFNDIKPIAYSEFLEDLCKQTLNMETENGKKNLTFVPLAPACVVIRVLSPIYAAHLPYSPFVWRLFWILLLFAMTFIMLASLKVMICMSLNKHAKWYINRCQKRKLHTD